MPTKIDLSIIITAHAEGILTHRTLRSVKAAVEQLKGKYRSEIILHIDNPTPETLDYINANKPGVLQDVEIFTNNFGDLGSSRNFAIAKAVGQYIATIDADDLMSTDWLGAALDMLTQQVEPTIAHSEFTVEFEGANSLVIKHGEIDFATDALLSVYANRWNSVIVAPRDILLKEKYTPNSLGFGYEDWHLNSRLIAKGVHNLLVPGTAIFVRRKATNSEWLRQIQSMAVLRANPLLNFSTIRKITNPFQGEIVKVSNEQSGKRPLKTRVKNRLKRYPLAHRAAIRVHSTMQRRKVLQTGQKSPVPEWLQKEWFQLHSIDRQIFPSPDLMKNIPVYDSITLDHKLAGGLYKLIVDQLKHDSYDYLLFVPWLLRGGADSYAINYANTISRLSPNKRVLVMSTLPIESVWSERLDPSVDFLNFGLVTEGVSNQIKHRLLGHIIENSGISVLHILNSELGYDFVELHEKYIKGSGKKVVVTSFSQSIDEGGRLYGYSHTHVPKVYDIADLITSDNQTVLDMWVSDYGFDPKKLVVHRQPIQINNNALDRRRQNKPLRLLWAARIAPEKQPELIEPIARLAKDIAVIDVYGHVESGCEMYTENLPENAIYKGSFNGLNSLPLHDYDALLYTSLFDGMPNTILEAASHNLPIISSAVGGIPEFVEHGKTGLLVKDIKNAKAYSDAISSLSADEFLGPRLAESALKKINSDFSVNGYDKNVANMLKTIDY